MFVNKEAIVLKVLLLLYFVQQDIFVHYHQVHQSFVQLVLFANQDLHLLLVHLDVTVQLEVQQAHLEVVKLDISPMFWELWMLLLVNFVLQVVCAQAQECIMLLLVLLVLIVEEDLLLFQLVLQVISVLHLVPQ